MLCLCTRCWLAACITCVVPVVYAVLAAQKRHVITCSTEQSSSCGYSAHAVGFRTNCSLRASAVVENRSLANCAVRHLRSNRAVDFCVYGVETISELEGTSDRASSRLLCNRCSVVDVRRRDDVASNPNNLCSTSPRGRTRERRREPRRVPSLPYFAVVRGIETCSYRPAATVPRRRVPTCRCTCRY